MIDFKRFGDKMSYYRKKMNLTQDELSLKLFVSRQALSKWEKGKAFPSIDTLLDICTIFIVSFEEILCLDDEIIIDNDNIFKGHSRTFIINKIINNELEVDIKKVFYQFSEVERMIILKNIKEKKINYDERLLKGKLTDRKYT